MRKRNEFPYVVYRESLKRWHRQETSVPYPGRRRRILPSKLPDTVDDPTWTTGTLWLWVITSSRTRQRRDTLISRQGRSRTDTTQKAPLKLWLYVTRVRESEDEANYPLSMVNERSTYTYNLHLSTSIVNFLVYLCTNLLTYVYSSLSQPSPIYSSPYFLRLHPSPPLHLLHKWWPFWGWPDLVS